MFINLLKGLRRDQRGAIALAMAVVLVPMMIASLIAIDLARIASARTVLQAAVDSAAVVAGGALNTSSSTTAAKAAAETSYAGVTATLSQLTMSLTSSTDNGLVSVYCQSNSNSTCSGSLSADTSGTCPSSYHYCVVIAAKMELSNLLLAWIVPQTWLSVRAIDTVGVASYTVNSGSFSSTSVGSAYDTNNILAYVVPTSSSGTTDFSDVPEANSSCTTGVIADETNKTTVSSSTSCDYELIGSSTGGTSSGSLSISSGEYIAFAFANLMGGTTHFGADTTYKYYSNITVSTSETGSGTTYANGACYNGSAISANTTGTSTCSISSSNSRNYTALYGECPAHNLYGSISEGTTGSLVENNATADDSLTIYSSAYEMLGYPPTHDVNHTLPSFTAMIYETINNKTFYVSVTCPNWPTTVAEASADGYTSQVPVDTDITAYATYYPDVTLTSSSVVYPLNLQSACSPASSYPSSGSSTSSSWWGWSSSNTGNCANQPKTSSGSYNTSYNDCALIIQPLGDDVPTSDDSPELPSYYVEVKATNSSSATTILLDPVYDSSTFTDLYAGVETNLPNYDSSITLTSTNSSGAATLKSSHATSYYPTSVINYKITSGTYSGYYAYISKPAENSSGGYVNSMPTDTSYRCYDPQDNGYSATIFLNSNDNGSSVDSIANPEFGAIDCSEYSGYSFGLYWNDMGGSASDDLGYWNAVTVFTCPTPTYTSGVSAPSTLSG